MIINGEQEQRERGTSSIRSKNNGWNEEKRKKNGMVRTRSKNNGGNEKKKKEMV